MNGGSRLPIATAIGALLLGMAAPVHAQAEPQVVHQRRDGFVVAGGVALTLSYGAALLAGMMMTINRDEDQCSLCSSGTARPPYIVVPIAGPLLHWGMESASSRGSPALWAAWSGLQAVGAAMLIIGVVGHDVVEWRPVDDGPTVSLAPAFTGQDAGLAVNVTW